MFSIEPLLKNIRQTANKDKLVSGFMIGSTVKKVKNDNYYITPIRNTGTMIVGGVIVYNEQQAINIAKRVDGEVDYILVDVEKKIPQSKSDYGDVPNIERRVREHVSHSELWVYKGNDLTVEAVDALLGHLYKDNLHGIGRTKIAILGAGNLGAKLALKLVERGANVFVTRRDIKKLEKITDGINLIKSQHTTAKVSWTEDNISAAKDADILIGATNGVPIITEEIIECTTPKGIIVDLGKGTITSAAIKRTQELNKHIYRVDVTAALCGLVKTLYITDEIFLNKMGRKKIGDLTIISGGVFGYAGEVVVDNINSPKYVYGVANGEGDFDRTISKGHLKKILQKILKSEGNCG